jgi:transmembrane sensor
MVRENSREIGRIASEWLAMRDGGRLTEAEEGRFRAWLAESTLHRVEFLRIEAAWQETCRLKALAAGIRSERPPATGSWNLAPFFDRPGARDSVNRRRAWRLAAGVLLAVAATVLMWGRWPARQQYATPVGGTASVPMSDGSRIVLNTNSQIRVALTAAERHVDLEQGEAFFEVANDASRPFVVEAGKKRVVAVGTQFSVRREGNAIEVVVTEGKVRVEDAPTSLAWRVIEPSSGANISAAAESPVLLTAGTVARAAAAGVLVQRKTIPEAEEELSWRAGKLVFRDATLADAIADFNRYSERKVVITDPAVAALKIEGSFRSNSLASFLELLQGGYPIKVIETRDGYALTAK